MNGRDRDDMVSGDEELENAGEGLFDGKEEVGSEPEEETGKVDSEGQEGVQNGVGRAKKGKGSKGVKRPMTARQKAIKAILRRSGKDSIPEMRELMRGKSGVEVKIKDLGLFIGEPAGPLMVELAKECPVRNQVNLSAEVRQDRMLQVGVMIVKAGRMYSPIHVARIEKGGKLECTSGRHRLAFLALAYGAEAKIPVYIENMTINEARDAVVVANQVRSTKALEKVEHAVLRAVGGNVDAEQDELYVKAITTKSNVSNYCVYSVVNRKYPMKLSFPVSMDSSRKGGGLTTMSNVGNFWKSALEWAKETTRKDFDAKLKDSVRFLNDMVSAMQGKKGFNPKQHLASKPLVAIGKYYRTYFEITGRNAVEIVKDVAGEIVAMGDIGPHKSEKTYVALAKALVPTKKK